jgi:4-amino-4-deoxy-L-arabinose transferase-like glycosyltransferase
MFLLAALCLACFLVTPVWYPLLDEDEPRYVATSLNMLESGDFLVPRFNDEPRYQKPVLTYWVMAASMALVGEEAMGGWEWPARLPSGLAATGVALLLYGTLARRQSRRAGWIAALGFVSLPMVMLWARAASTDMLLTLLLTAAVLCAWWAAEAARGRAKALYLLAAACAGLGFLTKGPVGAVLPLLIWGIHLGLTGRLRSESRRVPWLGAVAVFSIVGLSWYVAIYLAEGPAFFRSFFLRENLGRALTGAGGPKEILSWARLIVPTMVLVGLAPCSAFALAGLTRKPSRAGPPLRPLKHLLQVWFWVALIVFSLPQGQWPSYALPLAPAACLLAGSYLDESARARDGRLGPWAGAAGLAVFWVVVLTVTVGLAQSAPPEYSKGLPVPLLSTLMLATAAIIAIGTAGAVVARARATQPAAVGILLATWILGFGLFAQVTAPVLVRHLTGPRVAIGRYLAERGPDLPVLTYGARYSSLPFYAREPLEFHAKGSASFGQRVDRLRSDEGLLLVTDPGGRGELKDRWPMETVVDTERLLLLRIPPVGEPPASPDP